MTLSIESAPTESSLLWTFRAPQGEAAPGAQEELISWHSDLDDLYRRDRSRLRRYRELDNVFLNPALHRLKFRLLGTGSSIPKKRRRAFATIVALAASVQEHVEHTTGLGDQLAQPTYEGGATPALSTLRFRRLIAIESYDQLLSAMRRVIRLLKGRIDLIALADTVYCWTEESTRAHLAEQYYGNEWILKQKQS